MANANLFQAYLQPARSVADYSADMDKAESNKLTIAGQRNQNALGALTLQQTQGQIADATAKRNAIQDVFSKLGPQATPIDRARALQSNPLTANEGVAAEKAILDNAKTVAGTSKDSADAASKTQEAAFKAHDQHLQQLQGVNSPDEFMQWVRSGVGSGTLDLSKAATLAQTLQQDPNQFAAIKDKMLATGIQLQDRFKQEQEMARTKLTTDTSRANNRDTNATTRAGQEITRQAALQGGSVQVDGAGNMVVVPNKFVPGAPVQSSQVVGADGKPMKGKDGGGPKISSEVQRQIGGVISFDKDLSALETALKNFDPRNPADQTNPTKRAQIQSLSKQAQLSAKEAAALGALSGPDMALLEGILNDPTSMKGALSGSGGIAAQIAEARAGNKRRVSSLQQQYGDKSVEGLPAELKAPPVVAAPPATPTAGGFKIIGVK